ncbi:MAG: hypothetical protein GC179_06370 [Anaerolineaceae bacterium]|nr:hypothetical protein [Anaerolineaceae bacterium]
MSQNDAFDRFAPAVVQVYRRNPEAFWKAIMAPFLADGMPLLTMLRHLRVDMGLLTAFRGLDEQAHHILQDFGTPLKLDITQWKSNRTQYFKDAYPIFAFLAIWMAEEGLSDFLNHFSDVLRAAVYGVAGYGILDENVDSDMPSPVEILTAQALIAEYENTILRVFGVTAFNLGILHKMRTLFLQAEIKEKAARHIASPYTFDNPKDCGTKGAHSVTPFMLGLERLGRSAQIDDYWEVFLLFGAVIQIIDDWMDLEDDLAIGHFSYLTLGSEPIFRTDNPEQTAKLLRTDRMRIRKSYEVCKDMIDQCHIILKRLNDPFLVRLVDVTDLRLDSYFRKELKFTYQQVLVES